MAVCFRSVAALLAAISLSAGVRGQVQFDGRTFQTLNCFGQQNLQECAAGRVDGSKIYHAAGIVIDTHRTPNAIYVMDAGNNRVLGFSSFSAATPERVFGQPDALRSAANGDCYLGFTGAAARDRLCLQFFPYGTNVAEQWGFSTMDVDANGNLYVLDRYNNRVLVYNAPFSTNKSDGKGDSLADRVIGQPNFTANLPNQGASRNARTLDTSGLGPSSRGVTVDAQGNVWVADTNNFRVLRFPPGSNHADLVLGQPDMFSIDPAWGDPQTAPKNRMETPTVARVNPATGELYVLDEHREGFRGRIMAFTPPFRNGMRASRVIMPRQRLAGDFVDGYTFTHADGLFFNRFLTEDWIDPKTKHHKYRDGVVWVNDHTRCLLLDAVGNILLAVGAKDLISLGGKGQDYADAGINIDDDFNIVWPGGSPAFDDSGNIYLCDGWNHQICRYRLPYRKTAKVTLPNNNGGMFPGHAPNRVGPSNLAVDPSGLFVFNDQLVVRDRWRYMVWNHYRSKPLCSPADFFPGQPDGYTAPGHSNHIEGYSTHAIDHDNRMWCQGASQLMVWQLPMTDGATPLKDLIPLYWADDPSTQVDYDCQSAVTVEPSGNHLWLFDRRHHRLLRVRLHTSLATKFLVDMVIGQANKTDGEPNAGLDHPTAHTFGDANEVTFDRLGNLFVVDNTYELHYNGRVLAFDKADLDAASGLFPAIDAKHIYVSQGFNDPVFPRLLQSEPGPFSPVSVAFNSRNEMVLGNDGYWWWGDPDRARSQLFLYRHPLTKTTPDALITLPLGAPAEMCFDSHDNLLVVDGTWNKVWMLNYDQDPQWLRAL